MNQKIYRNVTTINCKLGDNIVIGDDSFLSNSMLDDYVQINRRNMIISSKLGCGTYTGSNTVIKQAEIGKYCSISWNVSMTGNYHEYKKVTVHPLAELKSFGFVEEDSEREVRRIKIGNDVWIGANASILPGVCIGDGSIIGMGGVLTKSIPPYAIAVGCPARVIGYRFSDEIIAMLLFARWWDWPHTVIQEHIEFFKHEINIETARNMMAVSESILKGKYNG